MPIKGFCSDSQSRTFLFRSLLSFIKNQTIMEKMKTKKSRKGVKLGIGIILGTIVGYLTSNMQLWFVLGIAIGAALEYGTQKKS